MSTREPEPTERAERERLAREMDGGYGAEAKNPSLDADWAPIEAEGL